MVNKLPLCKEVCMHCAEGEHVFHIMGELANLHGTWCTTKEGHKYLELSGWAEDELFLEQMMSFWATWRRE